MGDVHSTCLKDITEVCKLSNDGSLTVAVKCEFGPEVNILISKVGFSERIGRQRYNNVYGTCRRGFVQVGNREKRSNESLHIVWIVGLLGDIDWPWDIGGGAVQWVRDERLWGNWFIW